MQTAENESLNVLRWYGWGSVPVNEAPGVLKRKTQTLNVLLMLGNQLVIHTKYRISIMLNRRSMY